jgi:uncharacterized membrane protein YccF (DUF307 family)
MAFLLNLLWFILGGWLVGLAWFFGGLLLAITIVGLPWANAAWRIAGFAMAPFGKTIVDRQFVTGQNDIGTGPLGFLLNVIWILLAGWYIALAQLALAIACGVTIIGLPFAYKHLQLAWLALAPVGKSVERV